MTASRDRTRKRIGVASTLLVGTAGVVSGIAAGDLGTVVTGVAFVVVMFVIAGPVLRWMRRGEGPHDTSGPSDQQRAEYLRLRYPGDHQGG